MSGGHGERRPEKTNFALLVFLLLQRNTWAALFLALNPTHPVGKLNGLFVQSKCECEWARVYLSNGEGTPWGREMGFYRSRDHSERHGLFKGYWSEVTHVCEIWCISVGLGICEPLYCHLFENRVLKETKRALTVHFNGNTCTPARACNYPVSGSYGRRAKNLNISGTGQELMFTSNLTIVRKVLQTLQKESPEYTNFQWACFDDFIIILLKCQGKNK